MKRVWIIFVAAVLAVSLPNAVCGQTPEGDVSSTQSAAVPQEQDMAASGPDVSTHTELSVANNSEQVSPTVASPGDGQVLFGPGITRKSESEELKRYGFSPWRYLGSMVVMLLIFGGALVMIKRWRENAMGGGRKGLVTVASRTPIDAKHALVVARIHGEEVLIGVSPDNMTVLGRYALLTDDEEQLSVSDGEDDQAGRLARPMGDTADVDAIEAEDAPVFALPELKLDDLEQADLDLVNLAEDPDDSLSESTRRAVRRSRS